MDIIERTLETRSSKHPRKERVAQGGELISSDLGMVEEDGSLESTEEQHMVEIPAPSILDTNIDAEDGDDVQYEFRTEGIAYGVVQVSEEAIPSGSLTSTTHTIPGSPCPVQTLYSNTINGGIYVISPPHDVFSVASKNPTARSDERPTILGKRDDKRRQTHNEVERRRRDKINNWIMKLSNIIPDCKSTESSKGNFESQSKGGILAKACDYIIELRDSNQRLMVAANENEQLALDLEQVTLQMEELKAENERLRNLLQQHGIPLPKEEIF